MKVKIIDNFGMSSSFNEKEFYVVVNDDSWLSRTTKAVTVLDDFDEEITLPARCVEKIMEYKGYVAKVGYDKEAKLFHGDVMDIYDIITFECYLESELSEAFHISVDDYLDFCAKRGEAPEQPEQLEYMKILEARMIRL